MWVPIDGAVAAPKALRSWHRADLLQQPKHIRLPVFFDELPAGQTVEIHSLHRDCLPVGGTPRKVPRCVPCIIKMLETDWSKMEERIQAAETALHERKREFDLNRGTPEENHAIEAALRGPSRLSVAKKLGVHRRTVRQTLRNAIPPERKVPVRGQPRLGPVKEFIDEMLSLSDSIGVLAITYAYDSYGEPTNSTGTLTNSFRYTAREYDFETGLYYYRARYYDPETGRFISEDPVLFVGGQNFYDYIANAPVDLQDLLGYRLFQSQYPVLYLFLQSVRYPFRRYRRRLPLRPF